MPLYSEINYMDKLNEKMHSVMKNLVTQTDEASGTLAFGGDNTTKTTEMAAPPQQ